MRKAEDEGVQLERRFLLWKCSNAVDTEGCGLMNIRATKMLSDQRGWTDIQSRCPSCGRKKRLYRKNCKVFESREEAGIALEYASGRWL